MTITIPNTAAELEDMLGSGEKMAELFDSAGKPKAEFSEFIKAYVAKSKENDPGISQQIRDEVERVNAEWLKSNSKANRLPFDIENRTPRPKGYNPKAAGAPLDSFVNGSGEFFASIYHNQRDPELAAKGAKIRNDYGSAVPGDGGFLIPENLRATLLETALEDAVIRPRATVVPMDSLRVPMPIIDETTHAGSVKGGLVGYWTEESVALTESQATFGRVVLDAKKLTIYGEAPNELFQDSIISFQAFIDQKLPQALAWFEDVAFVSGSGVGEPLGFLNADAAVSTTRTSAGLVKWDDVVNLYARMLPSSLGRAVWIANIDTFPELAKMSLSVGTGGAPVWLVNGADNAPMTILGRPLIFTEKVSTKGTVGDLNFVDLSYYLIGDRQAMQAATSPHYKFANDQTVFRVVERVDGRPWLSSPITPAQGANTLSPFVKIAT